LYENAEAVRRLVSHPWLVEQANAIAAENSAITCSKWYKFLDGDGRGCGWGIGRLLGDGLTRGEQRNQQYRSLYFHG
jgi:hypothetical protein